MLGLGDLGKLCGLELGTCVSTICSTAVVARMTLAPGLITSTSHLTLNRS